MQHSGSENSGSGWPYDYIVDKDNTPPTRQMSSNQSNFTASWPMTMVQDGSPDSNESISSISTHSITSYSTSPNHSPAVFDASTCFEDKLRPIAIVKKEFEVKKEIEVKKEFEGTVCIPCRKRRIKCDKGWPECSSCMHAGIVCSRYPARGNWKEEFEEDKEHWVYMVDHAEYIRIQNRNAQRNYRKKLKSRLEDLERRAGTKSVSPEGSHAPETAELENITDFAAKKDKVSAAAAEVGVTISNMESCGGDFEANYGEETSKKLVNKSRIGTMPEELDDERLVGSHLNPYNPNTCCNTSTCGEASASSTSYLLRHDCQAHDMYENTAGNKVLSESLLQSELRTESEPGTEIDSDEVSELESDFEIDDNRYTDLIWLRDILQHEFQQALGAQDSQTKQDLCLIKDSLICYILERFWSWSQSRYKSSVTTYTGTPSTSSGSSMCETRSSEKSSQSSGQGSKRKRQANSNDSGDKRQTNRIRTKVAKEKPGKEQLQFSCPFRKHDPEKYGVMQWQYCALTPYSSIARLKEHLIRGPHRVWECDRCRRSFNKEKDKIHHAREEIPCSPFVEAYVKEEGIHPYHVEWLRAKGKSYCEVAGMPYSKQTESERWNTIYKKLFSCSDDMLPSPYFEEPMEERAWSFDSGDIGEFQQYFQEELPHGFRRRAAGSFTEDLIDQVSAIVEQCASDICTSFRERITKSSSCIQGSSHSFQDNTDPSPSNSSVPSLGVLISTNSSNNQSTTPGENDTGGIGSHTPSDSDSTMSILTHDTHSLETDPTSSGSYQNPTTPSRSLFQEPQSQGAKMRRDPTYDRNHENQSAQDVTHNGSNSLFFDDLGGGFMEDFFTKIANANLVDGTDLGGDINYGWNAYLANLDMDVDF